MFRDFAAIYHKRCRSRWKPSSLRTYDICMRGRQMPAFGRLRLDAIDHARVSAWFDAASVDKPGAANRAFEFLRAILASACQWDDRDEHVPDACTNIVRRPSPCPLGRIRLVAQDTDVTRPAISIAPPCHQAHSQGKLKFAPKSGRKLMVRKLLHCSSPNGQRLLLISAVPIDTAEVEHCQGIGRIEGERLPIGIDRLR